MSELRGARVLVTGGRGFLGRHLVRVLSERGANPLPLGRADGDLRDGTAVEELFVRYQPDFVVHAAVTGGGIGWMREHPADAALDNVRMATELLEAAARHRVRRFCGVSSACVYPRDAVQPMREDRIWDGAPEPTNGPYGEAKRWMMVLGRALHQQHGLDVVFPVPTNLYGPGDELDATRGHVVGALMARFEAARRAEAREVVCWGTGRATRDLLHVRDAAEGIVRHLEVGGGPEPVNLGSGEEHSISTIAHAIAVAVGFHGQIRWDPERPDGMPRKVLDISRARERLGWGARIGLAAGLTETVAWLRTG